MQNSMTMFTFFVFDRKYPFWANLVQKSKLSISNIQNSVMMFIIRGFDWKYLFWQIWYTKSKLLVSAEIRYLDYG